MAEWLVEQGIGEDRAVRLESGRIVEARLDWPGGLKPGLVATARIISKPAGSARGIVEFPGGERALVDRGLKGAEEGGHERMEVLREAIPEARRTKPAKARPSRQEPQDAPSLAEALQESGAAVRIVRKFPETHWAELVGEVFAGAVPLANGELLFSPTAAMTLIDIDTYSDPDLLAQNVVPPLASAIRRFGLGGSIGIDFPTPAQKAGRASVDRRLAEELADWPHERTAMNGFGFVHIVAKLDRPSLLHRACFQTARLAATQLLRRAEHLEGPGQIELIAHPAVQRELRPAWLEELRRRTAREIHQRANPELAIEAPHAQLVAR